MAMSKTTNTYNRQNWEDADFPILCQTCLGDNPYIRMTKEKYGKECKICSRPFTVFRWCPGARMRFKKTEVCQTCSRMKNVCQTCLLDLEYGLPIQVRDAALKVQDDLPRSDVNKEYYIQNMDSQMSSWDATQPGGAAGKSKAASELLLRLARTAPYYKRNRPHVCSFWVKGECRRGEECPYRHEKPTDPDDPLADQNIKDRYYGVNDPVAEKLMRRAAAMPALPPPEDASVTTLYVGNLPDNMTEDELKDHFYQYGEIRSLTLVPRAQCGFVQYATRAAAERAAEKTFNRLVVEGKRLAVKWGKSQGRAATGERSERRAALEPVPGLPGALPLAPLAPLGDFFGLAGPLGLPGPPGAGPSSAPWPPGAGAPAAPWPPGAGPSGAPWPPGAGPSGAPWPPGAGPSGAPWPPRRLPPAPPPLPALPERPPGPVHYPSQDPSRMGAHAASANIQP